MKDTERYKLIIVETVGFCRGGFDPVKDTESINSLNTNVYTMLSRGGFDPVKDTESGDRASSSDASSSGRGGFDPVKDTESYADGSPVAGSETVAEASIR